MKNKQKKLFYIVFGIICIGDLVGRILDSTELDLMFKPLLMPALLVFFIANTRTITASKFKKLMLFALVFAWLGDLFLLFEKSLEQPLFFMLGLGSFLIGHILYSFAFWNIVKKQYAKGFIEKKPVFILPFLIVGALVYTFLYPNLGDLKLPVFLYVSVILAMSIFALNVQSVVQLGVFQLIFFGSALFIISDSCIALNRFVVSFSMANFLIMLTYIAAQFLIVKGATLWLHATNEQ